MDIDELKKALTEAQRDQRIADKVLEQKISALTALQKTRDQAEAEIEEILPEVRRARHEAEMARQEVGSTNGRLQFHQRINGSTDVYQKAGAILRAEEART